MHETTKIMLERITVFKSMCDLTVKQSYWDLRVNHRVGDWIRAGKPNLNTVIELGFGYIQFGSNTSGPIVSDKQQINDVLNLL